MYDAHDQNCAVDGSAMFESFWYQKLALRSIRSSILFVLFACESFLYKFFSACVTPVNSLKSRILFLFVQRTGKKITFITRDAVLSHSV